MNTKKWGILLFLFLVVNSVSASDQNPVAISPGNEVGIASVNDLCPTFSWAAPGWAVAYHVEVYVAQDNFEMSHNEMARSSFPVLVKEIQGAATSWTPSAEEGLQDGASYVWYVQALDDYGRGVWSQALAFRIEVIHGFNAIEDSIKKNLQNKGVEEDIIDEVLSNVRSDLSLFSSTENPRTAENSAPLSVLGWEGTLNTYYGYNAGLSLTTGTYNTFIGRGAGYLTTSGYNNTYIGDLAGNRNTIGYFNTYVGHEAGYHSSASSRNSFFGRRTGYNNGLGSDNTFIGDQTGLYNTTGQKNVCLGWLAGTHNLTGDSNTSLGFGAGFYNTGTGNIFLGNESGYNETGSNKLYIDNSNTSSPLIYGEFDNNIVALMGNVGVGTKSPAFPLDLKRTRCNAAVVVDRTDGATNYINATQTAGNFGTVTNHVLRLIVGSEWKLRLHTDNSLTMRNGASCTVGGVWTNASSRELKENIESLSTKEALDTLQALDPVKYNYKAEADDNHIGFIAEDVPDLVASKDRKAMSPMDVVAVLTKVLQEQQGLAEKQQMINEELRAEIAELKAKLNPEK